MRAMRQDVHIMWQVLRSRSWEEAISSGTARNPQRYAQSIMKTVLAAIDFSPVSQAVLKAATQLARALDARIVLLNVVQPPSIATDLAPLVGEVLQFTAEIERGARRHLHRIEKRLVAAGQTVEAVCHQGFPVPEIIAHARELEASYIVLGSHGHTAFHDLVAGSVASGVLKRTTCPVVVVPAGTTREKRRKSRRK